MSLCHWLLNCNPDCESKESVVSNILQYQDDIFLFEELKKVAVDTLLLAQLNNIFGHYSWDIVDAVFDMETSLSSIPLGYQSLLTLLFRFMNPKEWEIIIFEKASSCYSQGAMDALFFCCRLILLSRPIADSMWAKSKILYIHYIYELIFLPLATSFIS
jgi:hypothetical protein